jgi:hypothetical protein
MVANPEVIHLDGKSSTHRSNSNLPVADFPGTAFWEMRRGGSGLALARERFV